MGIEEHAAVITGPDPTGIDSGQPDGYVLGFQEIDETQVAVVGGKGAHLGRSRGSKASACPAASA